MIWLGLAWKWLRGLPWQVWAAGGVLALLAAVWLHGRHTANVKCEARWEAAQEATQAEIDRRERAAFKAGAEAARQAHKAQQDTRKETDEAVERVRVQWREKVVRVPAECRAAVALPDGVRDEGRKAVAAARSALQRP